MSQKLTGNGETNTQNGHVETPPSILRAEQLMDSWGRNVGLFIGTTQHRLQNSLTSIKDEADRMDQPKQPASPTNGMSPSSTETPVEQGQVTGQIVTQRAEQLVDGFAQRAGAFAVATELQIRRASAFLREDAEDIWAEAQGIRHQRRTH